MSRSSLTSRLLDWVNRLPAALSRELAVDVSRKRLRLSHARVEELTRRLLRDVRSFELGSWSALPQVYDVRFAVAGWKLRAEVALERVEVARGRFLITLLTPGRVEVEESRAASTLLQGVLRASAGTAALRAVLDRVLPENLKWDGQRFRVDGPLPREGLVSARLFESSSVAVSAEHGPDGLWLSAEEWPRLMDLLGVMLGTDLPRTPPGA